ncbi:MAG: preprotein translocase subunit SecE [Thermoleophilaceae bacterium]|nr:preprotein translocase subunit SecE [Thermoleophilaceae bacterium]
MARDRQEAKRRQAERREARLRDRAAGGRVDGEADANAARTPNGVPARELRHDGAIPEEREPDPIAEAQIAAGAPPETAGRSDTVVDAPPPAPELEGDERPTAGAGGRDRGEEKERGRVVAFLVAVRAELRRVQWPDRKTLTTLTGVVLGFVVIAGAYLGALDAIFSRLIQALL